MSIAELQRLRELEQLDEDGVPLTTDDYAEMRELINRENADFVARSA